MDHPIPFTELPPSIQKFCDPSGPLPGRLMVAKGAVPLKPMELLTVLYCLSYDQDQQVRKAAEDKYSSLPENVMEGTLAGALDPRVIDFYADRFTKNDKLLQAILLNQRTADETVARCASRASETISEIIATNEQRLLRHPKIIENLYNNQNARMSTVNRAIELAVRNDIVLTGLAAFKEAAAAIQGELIIDEGGPTPGDQIFAETLEIGAQLDREEGQEMVEAALSEAAPPSEKRLTVHQKLSEMSASEKVRVAMIGQAIFRSFLIRDNNHLVAMAAIKSPQVKDTEVLAYARNKTLADEVIRHIADRKDWTKGYAVKLALVENPKTPLPKALSFLTHLRQNDLRAVSRSKNVPAAIAAAARNHLSKRT